MSWPTPQDYNEAIQNPGLSFEDPDLREGEPVTNPMGLPMPQSGSVGDVYEIRSPRSVRFAVKCFTREPAADLKDRYALIAQHLREAKLPFTIKFAYVERGILAANDWRPIVKMEWVEGFKLNEFVQDSLKKPALLEGLFEIWTRMAERLSQAKVGHCDLQHGNVLLIPAAKANTVTVRLVDYDGMFVPKLAHLPPGESGHSAFQHPRRAADQLYSLEVDRFSTLLIATALRSLIVGGEERWKRYNNGHNLLFRETDLHAPDQSALFRELIRSKDPLTAQLAEALRDACRGRLDQIPPLRDLLETGPDVLTIDVEPLPWVQEPFTPPLPKPQAYTPPLPPSPPPPPTAFDWSSTDEQLARPRKRPRHRRRKQKAAETMPLIRVLVICGVGLLMVLLFGRTALERMGVLSAEEPETTGVEQEKKQREIPEGLASLPPPVVGEEIPAPVDEIPPQATDPNPLINPEQHEMIEPALVFTALPMFGSDNGMPTLVRVGFLEGNRELFAISDRGLLYRWDYTSKILQGIFPLEGNNRNVERVVISSDRQWAGLETKDGEWNFYALPAGDLHSTLRSGQVGGHQIALTTSDQGIMTFIDRFTSTGATTRWESTPQGSLSSSPMNITASAGQTILPLAISPTSVLAALTEPADPDVLVLWHTRADAAFARLRGHTDRITVAEFSPDGTYLLTGSEDGTARLWHVSRQEEVVAFNLWGGPPARFGAFSSDGRRLVITGDEPNPALVYDLTTFSEVGEISGVPEVAQRTPVLSADGKRVLVPRGDSVLEFDLRAPTIDLASRSRIDPRTRRVLGAIEGETLIRVTPTGGNIIAQDMAPFRAGVWSGGQQWYWFNAQPGDRVTLPLEVTSAGRYQLSGMFTKARDYAIVRLSINDQLIGEPFDLFNQADVITSGLIDLESVELALGRHQLTIQIAGANPLAVPAYMVGIDYLRLDPVP